VGDLNGRVAVITGAASGIGFGLARELAASGCRLSLADIDAEGLEQAGDSLRGEGFEVLCTRTDVGRLEDVEKLAAATIDRFGAAHLTVNNAGVIAWNPIASLAIGDWKWVMDVNVWGVIHGLHVFLPIMKRQGEGHIVNVSSIGGVLADTPFMATYSATKGAVIGLSLTLASELRLQNQPIGVTIVCPSGTRDTRAHLAERNRPASLGELHREPAAQALLDMVADQVAVGQPMCDLTLRVVEAVRRNQLWVFPHPDSAPLIQPRLDAVSTAVSMAGQTNDLMPESTSNHSQSDPRALDKAAFGKRRKPKGE
jgi:NAD(P)-dependent dehydrogenase (short-subunit alcohol dehydrogenase family)